ncbi:WD40/YVTN/BNR-like repeat-containing protein [Massilia cavernae]|uniref:Glycosyl hydrolase n=1 Tax=Massilia cavernae TaxID=2320864 RepID=A0A418Y6H1_9BURK|nr:YCF48-related protein [Massilia cavernae]RJG23486.1 glycosyl hydrolase [Massilia cavernae]
MNSRSMRIITLALACQLVSGPSLGSGFKDPLERPSAMIGSLAQNARLTAIARGGKRLIAAGPRGMVLLSDDEGTTWKQVQVPLSSDLVALHFRSAERGWAVGHDGVILHTADGGLTWSRQLDGIKAAALIGRHYAGRNLGAGPADVKLREDVQRFVDDGADKPFLDILFTSDTEGFAVGAFNLAMHTTDGGKSWEPLIDRTENPSGFHLYALAQAGGELYAAGEQGLLLRWNRAAGKFDSVKSPYRGSYFGLLGKGDTLFAFGLQGKAFRSSDAGQNWTQLRGTGSASLTGATVLPDGRILFISQGGKLLLSADDGETFSEVSAPRPMPYFGVAPASGRTVAVVGSNGAATIALP